MGSSSILDPAFGPSAGSREGLDGGYPLGHPSGLRSLGPTVPSAHSWGRRAGSRQALGLGAPLPARRRRHHKPDITVRGLSKLGVGVPRRDVLGLSYPPPPGAHGSRGQARKGGRTSGSPSGPPSPVQPLGRAPTSAQVLAPRQQRQQQVAARGLPARAQLPARLHGSRRRYSPAPNFPGAQRGHGLSGPGPASERLRALLGAEPTGRPGTRSLGPRGGRSGRGAGPRGGAGPGGR